MPSDPRVKCIGIVPDKCRVFKSAVKPMRLVFKAEIEETIYDDEEETKETEALSPEEESKMIDTNDPASTDKKANVRASH